MTDNTQVEQVTAEVTAEATPELTLSEELSATFDAQETEGKTTEVEELLDEEVTEIDEVEDVDDTEEVDNKTDEERKLSDEADKLFQLIPKDWSKEEQEAFQEALNSDDEKIRIPAELLIERYNNFKKGFIEKTNEYASKTRELTEINKIFAPYEANLKAANIDKKAYISQLVEIDKQFGTDPAGTIKGLMQKFKVTPEQLGIDEFGLQEEANYDTNEIEALKAEINSLRNQVSTAPIANEIRQFAEAKDQEGKLSHPYFEQVRPIMATLINSDNNMTMEQAYRKALKVNEIEEDKPTINIDAIKMKVARAKKANKSVKTNGGTLDFANMSLADELSARFDGLN
jgi:hypothetical protein